MLAPIRGGRTSEVKTHRLRYRAKLRPSCWQRGSEKRVQSHVKLNFHQARVDGKQPRCAERL